MMVCESAYGVVCRQRGKSGDILGKEGGGIKLKMSFRGSYGNVGMTLDGCNVD